MEPAVRSTSLDPQQYRTLLELSKAIASHRSLTDLFHDLAERLSHFFDFHYLAVMLHDESRHVMRLHIKETHGPAFAELPSEIPIEGSISGWVWRNQHPMIIEDINQETRFSIVKTLRDKYPVRSVCSLPLTTSHKQLGVLNFMSNRTGAYDGLDLEFARLVAAQIAVVVDNAFNFEEAQSYQSQLMHERDRSALLLEINNMLVSNLNLRELLSALSACLRRVVPHDIAGLALYDPITDRLRIKALESTESDDLFIEGETLPLEGHPAGEAFTRRETIVIRDAESSEMLASRFSSLGMKSGCIVPLVSHDSGLGTLSVGSRTADAFNNEDVELLEQIAKQVAIAVENALSFRKIEVLKNKLNEEKLYLEEEIRTSYNFEEIIGNSSVLKRVLQQVETVAGTDTTVLICGESGTGKELIARALHNLSGRRERTLVKVNCAAIPTGLLESELFGHERGAFTGAIERRIGRFELAHQGTIFLDEVGDIPMELQPKLLRVLQEHEFERLGSSRTTHVNVRVVAATNTDLAQMVAERRFRSDLYYRLNVFPITLPALRERPDDIPVLVHFFASRFARQMGKMIERIPAETMSILVAYSWPGNIRELENLMERAVILSRGSVLEIPLGELKQLQRSSTDHPDDSRLENIERTHILRILNETGWVIGGSSGAAARLGLNRTTLNNRLRKLNITRPRVSQ